MRCVLLCGFLWVAIYTRQWERSVILQFLALFGNLRVKLTGLFFIENLTG
jgi:hypothetical protein